MGTDTKTDWDTDWGTPAANAAGRERETHPAARGADRGTKKPPAGMAWGGSEEKASLRSRLGRFFAMMSGGHRACDYGWETLSISGIHRRVS
jgi:hypothetical protein